MSEPIDIDAIREKLTAECSGKCYSDRECWPCTERSMMHQDVVPQLCDEVERLRTLVAEYRGRYNQAQQEIYMLRRGNTAWT